MPAPSLWPRGVLLVALPLAACGQAMVEYSLGVGRAAATAPAAKKAGEAAAAAFGKLGKTLEPGSQSPRHAAAVVIVQ